MLTRMLIFSISTVLLVLSASAQAEKNDFNRFTAELTPTLESDAGSVMARGFTFETAAKLCKRIPGPAGESLSTEYVAWKGRNNEFIAASVSVLNKIGDQFLPYGGEPAKQGYFRYVIEETAKAAMKRISSQLGGANLNNEIAPPESTCSSFTKLLRDGAVDYKNNPELTRALAPYMQRDNP